ncbi:response regulator [Mucilaginibacter celer]|uniref:Response regulator n=1 Tax=Mucilaginibacter celer TaxID=2305508 RepID=A0A494VV74_9SPHI|nr:response regulator [Mucilaginibacter celer]AYL95165.1 response regulator [Mucilaginibacter celer]
MKTYKNLDAFLLVDDDLPTNFIHTRVIKNTSIAAKVEVATNVQDALDFLTYAGKFANTQNTARPGLIFLDINMPGLSGWDFLDAYEKLDAKFKAQAVVIMVTTSLNPGDREKALKNKEVVEFLNKPLRPDLVAEVVARYFDEEEAPGTIPII